VPAVHPTFGDPVPETIPAAAQRLLDEPNFAHVVTLMADGTPQTTPVWIDRDGDVAVFNTAKGRVKHENLVRDPRVALSVLSPDNPYAYLQVRGRAEFVDEGAREHIDKLSNKYLGKAYPSLQPGEQRVIVRVVAEDVDFHGGR
jgi:PPOX class probable F420-dependent enzyme